MRPSSPHPSPPPPHLGHDNVEVDGKAVRGQRQAVGLQLGALAVEAQHTGQKIDGAAAVLLDPAGSTQGGGVSDE